MKIERDLYSFFRPYSNSRWIVWFVFVLLLTVSAACSPAPAATIEPIVSPETTETFVTPESAASSTASATPEPACRLTPIVTPTLPAEIPGYVELDTSTGLHMTGEVQRLDLAGYRLEVIGKVDHPLSLSYDDLRCLPRVERYCTLVCPGYFEDRATWAGASLPAVLDRAGVLEGASGIRLVSADGYALSVPLQLADSEENFLAYEWEGEPLPILHGFPVRAVFPLMQGNKWVKWLVTLEVY